MSLLQPDPAQVQHLIQGLSKALPGDAGKVFANAVTSATGHKSGSLVTVIVGLVIAVWSASGGMVALETALDVAYEVPTNAKFAKKRIKALILMLCTVVFGGIASIFIVESGPLGTGIESHMPVHGTAFLRRPRSSLAPARFRELGQPGRISARPLAGHRRHHDRFVQHR